MIKIIKHQVSFMLRQNIALMVFYILLAIALLNFCINVMTFQGVILLKCIIRQNCLY